MNHVLLSTYLIVIRPCLLQITCCHIERRVAEDEEKDWNGCEPLIVEKLSRNAPIPQNVLADVISYESYNACDLPSLHPMLNAQNEVFLSQILERVHFLEISVLRIE